VRWQVVPYLAFDATGQRIDHRIDADPVARRLTRRGATRAARRWQREHDSDTRSPVTAILGVRLPIEYRVERRR